MAFRGIRNLIYRLLPRPRARRRDFDSSRIRRIVVFRKGPNPTFTYYLEERLRRVGVPVTIADPETPVGSLQADGTFVIFCRYALPKQVLWLWKHRSRLSGAALFVDDDIAATVAEGEGTFDYRLYLLGLGLAPLPLMNPHLTHVWASTKRLADRLGTPDLVTPFPPERACRGKRPATRDDGRPLTIVFYANGAHDGEHRFLVPVVSEVLRRFPEVHFDVIAAGRPARLWRRAGIEAHRLALRENLPWPAYHRHTAEGRFDIALVPLLQSLVNDARSDTKRIDIARMAAAAVFSDGPIYRRSSVETDILVENHEDAWIEAISRLVLDETRRRQAAEAAKAAIERMKAQATVTLPGLEALN